MDEEGTTNKAGVFSTTFSKLFLGKWLEMCSFLTNLPPNLKLSKSDTPADFVT